MTLYLDNCCYNRPFDDQTQDRIHIESEAILAVLKACENGMITILSSPIVRMEIDKFSNADKREKVLALYSLANPDIPFTEKIKKRAEEIRTKSSIRVMDSLHVATAEAGKADAMLTTDDKLIKACSKLVLDVKVVNPITFLLEMAKGDGE
ncbi:MAG: type II toxin-antitoxin system VapC family toxin [Treponema sp.]|nr:type II toxin-antitoxin system VapC family toxin [Treponema sp.]